MVNRKELNPEASPEAAYGARLRSEREARGWKQDDLAALIGYTGRHVSGVETGRKPPTRRFSAAVDAAMGLEGASESFKREWGKIEHGVLLQGFPEYVDHEGRAVEIRLYEVGVIPGLLQTSEYAQVIENGHLQRGAITAEQAAERLSFLAGRQSALQRDRPPMMLVVLDESCIRRTVGGPEVMGSQLDWLVEFAELPNAVLQIAPFSMGELRPFNHSLALLTLRDMSAFAYAESQMRGHLERDNTYVLPLLKAYHQLQGEALSPAASKAMIREARKGTP
ncbi:helix-turn-helix domain-containing protein [Streptomyces lonarensis]|uniref:Helix-turn-helix domain-containing protein n=1 Tax=Streptomyces lonarensis TaxID=700599 RepID=A0A7X6CZV8_9ACTN|nr:helix-turn-helix transcriptional regulator [Streptomyces lonarensis]NJQ05612.1 helix-turn-helix domain-containing protein [Streptomyces lonarensis]